MKVTVENAQVIPGQRFRSQWALIELNGMDFPFQVGLGEESPPYQPGEYMIDESCFGTNKYHKLELSFVRLVPVDKAANLKSA